MGNINARCCNKLHPAALVINTEARLRVASDRALTIWCSTPITSVAVHGTSSRARHATGLLTYTT
jgi:hypothetical protein